MSEIHFAKSFLVTLDAKPSKYSPNHAFDPKSFATRIPFTLPKLPHPPHPLYPKSTPSAPPAPGSTSTAPTISLNLKSSRNPALTLTLSDINPATTTVAQLRESVQNELGGDGVVAIEKIKLLFNKKPIPSSKKTVSDVIGDADREKGKPVEIGVMVMGGAVDPPAQTSRMFGTAGGQTVATEAAAAQAPPPDDMEGIEKATTILPPVQGPSGKQVWETDEFWTDLQGFLEQRIKDEIQAARLVHIWKASCKTD